MKDNVYSYFDEICRLNDKYHEVGLNEKEVEILYKLNIWLRNENEKRDRR